MSCFFGNKILISACLRSIIVVKMCFPLDMPDKLKSNSYWLDPLRNLKDKLQSTEPTSHNFLFWYDSRSQKGKVKIAKIVRSLFAWRQFDLHISKTNVCFLTSVLWKFFSLYFSFPSTSKLTVKSSCLSIMIFKLLIDLYILIRK